MCITVVHAFKQATDLDFVHVELDKLGSRPVEGKSELQLQVEAELEDTLGGKPTNADGSPMLSGYFGILLPALFIDGQAQKGTNGQALHFWLQEAVAADPMVLCTPPDPERGIIGAPEPDAYIQRLVDRAL